MPYKLVVYAAGSNSHGQLGIGSQDDAHQFTRCPTDIVVRDDLKHDVKITAGAHHTLLLIQGGDTTTLYAAGADPGQKEPPLRLTFTKVDVKTLAAKAGISPIPDDLHVTDIASGWQTHFVLLGGRAAPEKNQLIAYGTNDYFQLASENTSERYAVVTPPDSSDSFATTWAGPRHTAAKAISGQLYAWGAAKQGQLGRPSSDRLAAAPQAVVVAEHAKSAALGAQHSLLLDATGVVHAFGSNKRGQLGCGDVTKTSYRISAQDLNKLALDGDASLDITSLHANWSSSFILTTDEEGSRLFSFGNNAFGQIGRDEDPSASIGEVRLGGDLHRVIRQFAAGSEHALALVDANEETQVWGWGWNEHGNLGLGSDNLGNESKPIKIWSAGDFTGKVHIVHAGNGTSWVVCMEWTL